MVRRHVGLLAVSLALVTACGTEPVGSPGDLPSATLEDVSDAELHFLRPAPDAPPLAQTSASFYAVRGESRQVRIMYRARPTASDSTQFLRFEVPHQSLVRRPDGTLVAEGDSLLITLTVSDSDRLIVNFEPAGLLFDTDAPARLSMSYAETDDDVNADGVVDALDDELESLFQIWRQEQIGDPFFALASLLNKTREVVSASISGFTNYAISY